MGTFKLVPLYSLHKQLYIIQILEEWGLENNIECINDLIRYINNYSVSKPLNLSISNHENTIKIQSSYISDCSSNQFIDIISISVENIEGEIIRKELFGVKKIRELTF